jgi:glycosyltransferase involved in cell wall biosynthesis
MGGLGTAVGGLAVASADSAIEVGVLLINGRDWAGSLEYYGESPLAVPAPIAATAPNGTPLQLFQLPRVEVQRALDIVASWRPDVVHVHTAWLLPVVTALRRYTNVPVVYTVHALFRAEHERGRSAPSKSILRNARNQETLLQLADRVIVLSRDEHDLASGYYPEAQAKLRIVGNGVHDRPWPTGARTAPDPTILYVGRIDERKGIRELLAAIPMILQQLPHANFVLAGGWRTSTPDAQRRRWLRGIPGLDERRIHFTGWLGPEELASQYSKAHILVVPSRYEPFGIVILEGMLHGLAIAAAAVGGPSDILEHRRTGLLFPPGDSRSLADAVTLLAKDRRLRAALGTAAAQEVRRHWLWPRIVGQLRGVYDEVGLTTRQPTFPFLVGHARSGTTLLRALLDSHSELAIPWESYFIPSLYRKYAHIRPEALDLDGFVADLYTTPFKFWGIPRAEIRRALAHQTVTGYPDLIRGIFAHIARRSGKRRYGDKTPKYTGDIALIGSLLPEAKFVHIIRDGRDVALSLQQVAWGVRNVEEAARSWSRHVREAIAAGRRLGPERYLEIHYEQLVAAPEQTLTDVCRFIGLEFEADMLNYFQRAHDLIAPDWFPQFHRNLFSPITTGLRDWRRDMPSRDVAAFESLSGDLLAELGYELTSSK